MPPRGRNTWTGAVSWGKLPCLSQRTRPCMAYVVTLTREGLRVGTVKYHLASIRMAQIGEPWPG